MEIIDKEIKDSLNGLEESIAKSIDNVYNEILRIFLPDSIEDKVIDIKDRLGLSKLSKKVENFTKKMINNRNEEKVDNNIDGLNLEKETDNIISSIKDAYNLTTEQSSKLEKNKEIISNNLEELEKEIKNCVKAFEKNDKYINEWKEYYNSKDFKNMEKVFKRIDKNMKDILPIEDKIKEIRELENIHLLIKRKGGDFNLTNEELELAKKLV